MIVEIEGEGPMRDLIKFIKILFSDNCQHFSERLFNQLKKPSQDTRRPNSTAVPAGVGITVVLLAYVWAKK